MAHIADLTTWCLSVEADSYASCKCCTEVARSRYLFDPIRDPYADELPRTSANGTEGHLLEYSDLATFGERQRTCGMVFDSPVSTLA
jgi:hypothetical protein